MVCPLAIEAADCTATGFAPLTPVPEFDPSRVVGEPNILRGSAHGGRHLKIIFRETTWNAGKGISRHFKWMKDGVHSVLNPTKGNHIQHFFCCLLERRKISKLCHFPEIAAYTFLILNVIGKRPYHVIVPLQGSSLRRIEVTWWVSDSKYKTVVPRCKTCAKKLNYNSFYFLS